MVHHSSLLRLLQLTSPSLPVGAYSYSEGLEMLCDRAQVNSAEALHQWIVQELNYGSARIDTAIALRSYRCALQSDWTGLIRWNRWLSANRETEELRLQSLQMGRSLLRLLKDLSPKLPESVPIEVFDLEGCHFSVLFGCVAALWEIDQESAILGYLHSWMSNLIAAGIKLIPLGQTAGQQLLIDLNPILEKAAVAISTLPDEQLSSCGWGLSIASMAHETQYSRLFRS